MLREDIKKGLVGGLVAEQIKVVPIEIQDAILKARIQAVHDVGTGICIHNFSQTPCEAICNVRRTAKTTFGQKTIKADWTSRSASMLLPRWHEKMLKSR